MSSEDNSQGELKPRKPRRWLKWLTGLFLLALFIITFLPVAVQHIAESQLKKMGFTYAVIEDVDINIFNGKFAISGVTLGVQDQSIAKLQSAYLDISLRSLFEKHLLVEQLSVSGLTLALAQNNDGQWIIAGYQLPATSAKQNEPPNDNTQNTEWSVGIDGLYLQDINADIQLPKITTDVKIEKLAVDSLYGWAPESVGKFNLSAKADSATVEITGNARPFLSEPEVAAQLQINELNLGVISQYLKEFNVSDLESILSLTVDASVKVVASKPIVKAGVELNLLDTYVSYPPYSVKSKNINWGGTLQYATPGSDKDIGVRSITDISISHLQVVDNDKSIELAKFDRLNIDKINLKSEQRMSIDSTALNKLVLLSNNNKETVSTIDKLSVRDIQYDGNKSVVIRSASIDSLSADIQIEPDGALHIIRDLQPKVDKNSDSKEATKEENDKKTWVVKFDELMVKENAVIKFVDKSVKPEFKANITPLSIVVKDVNTADSKNEVAVSVKAVVNEHETIELDSKIKPFGEKLNLTANADIRAVELPPLSPYIDKQIGYYLKQGQLNAKVNARVTDNQLDTKIDASLNKFKIEEGDPAKAQSMAEKLSMPLDAALDLLRDKNDNIRLEMTVDGDISDPKFDASKVINKAMANATKLAVTTYIKYMLQPLGALITVANIAGKVTAPKFKPVGFDAAQTEIVGDNKAYLEKIANLLQERPKLTLNICGKTSEQDRQELQKQMLAEQQKALEGKSKGEEQKPVEGEEPIQVENDKLIELAVERGKRTKDYIVKQGIDSGRLFTCHPNMEGAEESTPLVDLSL